MQFSDHYYLRDRLTDDEINSAIESVKNPSVFEAIETAPERTQTTDKAIESLKNSLVPEVIEFAHERVQTLDSIREKIELRELLDRYHHPTNAMRIQIERDPEVR